MKSYIVRDVAKEIGVCYATLAYHFKYLKKGVDYSIGKQGDQFNPSTITEDALIHIANSGKFKYSSILLRFLELNKACGLDVPNEESNESENYKKALEYLQEKYTQLEKENNAIKGDVKSVSADYNNLLQECLELQGFKDKYSKMYTDMENALEVKERSIQNWIGEYEKIKNRYDALHIQCDIFRNSSNNLADEAKNLSENNKKLTTERDAYKNSSNILVEDLKRLDEKNRELEAKLSASNNIRILSENSKEFDTRTTILLIWNIVITVLIALSYLK